MSYLESKPLFGHRPTVDGQMDQNRRQMRGAHPAPPNVNVTLNTSAFHVIGV